MRDPKRISIISDKLKKVWKEHPEIRFCQLLYLVASEALWNNDDLFYLEDWKLEEGLNKILDRLDTENNYECKYDFSEEMNEIKEIFNKLYNKLSENKITDYRQSSDLEGSIVHLRMNNYNDEIVEVYNEFKNELLFTIHIDYLNEIFPNVEEYEINRLLVEKNIFIEVKVFSETTSIYAE